MGSGIIPFNPKNPPLGVTLFEWESLVGSYQKRFFFRCQCYSFLLRDN
jgi:hypothetical protein